MSELDLDQLLGHALPEQLVRVGVPQRVGMYSLREPQLRPQPPAHVAHVARLHRRPVERAEDRPVGIHAEFTAKLEPRLQRLERLRVHPGKPRLAALPPPHPDPALLGA
jgi:hypothetical protein